MRISPTLVGELAPMIEASIAGGDLDHRLAVLGDPAFEEGDCRIDWSGGGVIRDDRRCYGAKSKPCWPIASPRASNIPWPPISNNVASGETHV